MPIMMATSLTTTNRDAIRHQEQKKVDSMSSHNGKTMTFATSNADLS